MTHKYITKFQLVDLQDIQRTCCSHENNNLLIFICEYCGIPSWYRGPKYYYRSLDADEIENYVHGKYSNIKGDKVECNKCGEDNMFLYASNGRY